MINVLIISDNKPLVSFIQNLVTNNATEFQGVKFDYRYSTINKNPDSLISLGLTSVNVKSEATVADIIEHYSLVISAHCKQIFPEKLVNNVRCINIHPGLNPHNRGWFPQVFAIINKKPVGCTIHLMNEEIDDGAILFQKEVPIFDWDTSLNVYERVQQAEMELLDLHFCDLVFGRYEQKVLEEKGNYNGISDFKALCNLDLNQVGTLREHIDLLRALSHGEFKNAYFTINEGKKVFLSLNFDKEN
ncbi:dTDP-4-amino-4,6-dideoxyglucose formyltransferase [Rheinheimera oceanensis]|uniref:dTDP-4-amino-4,6-dideoxyglucose formyltransferase n=1 Tax=Rheinheimera oceanensis TaxID=2817449 RepID=UPI001BFE2764|nr:dTDP-4-amino-4,6-dideoxyglucose formyltransferase [Rheinheimera oceanensis]